MEHEMKNQSANLMQEISPEFNILKYDRNE